MIAPVIKWSGSKRSMAANLSRLLPLNIKCYYEPFVGSGALIPYVLRQSSKCGDSLTELVDLWSEVKSRPLELGQSYARDWEKLQEVGHTHYYKVRDHFNYHRDAASLLFLSRTCVNGLIRFNSEGNFNNSLHHTRPGVHPDRLQKVLLDWSRYVEDVDFNAGDYRSTLSEATAGDFAFLDPPYAGTRGRYMPGSFDFTAFVTELERLTTAGVRWMVTCDGSAGSRDYADRLPQIPYKTKLSVGSGHSPFTRLMGTSLDDVAETVFLNYEPLVEGISNPQPDSGHGLQLSLIG